MTTLAFVYAQMGRGGEGVTLLEQALCTLESRGLTSHHSLGVLRLGEGYLLAGRSAEARPLAERAQMLTREYGERGYEAWALRLTGDVLSHEDQLDVEAADRHYCQALALSAGLEMRPLVAHCHLGLGKLYRRTGKHTQAQEHLTVATTMYRDMGMTYWLERLEGVVPFVE
jgi:tetratricopeptide (TPR) repeat protein